MYAGKFADPAARYLPVDLTSIRLDSPLPFSLVDKNGMLLAKKGFVFASQKLLVDLANHGGGFYVDFSDLASPELQGAKTDYVNHLFSELRKQRPMGDIARVALRYPDRPGSFSAMPVSLDWRNQIRICHAVLHVADGMHFLQRLDGIAQTLTEQVRSNPDDMLLSLFYLAVDEPNSYSATHSLLVSAICALTATEVLHWSAPDIAVLIRAALTMNIGMTALQDRLNQQIGPPEPSQRAEIGNHATLSVRRLQALGVDDALWLDVVRHHHTLVRAPLQAAAPHERLAGLIQRADVFAARLTPRVSRQPSSNSVAMQSIFLDGEAGRDQAGAALIKAVGVYHPGSFVKLESAEVAVVLRRGSNTASPAVAVVLNRQGLPVVEPIVRNTLEAAYTVRSAVARTDVKVDLRLDRLLRLNQAYRRPPKH